ncbi:hypothetical protein KP79_PYT17578 [Mizuhopecten yessoensis]|uniref:Peptidase A2 domain-containing protein n=1 Tax=Mizuhopecten yessoensis TaxID=6573 RepID=A0A210QGA1_MIZYE|nr:hypothetical protein KP79_PYT17578 [Mizuhopecten yessoensis]
MDSLEMAPEKTLERQQEGSNIIGCQVLRSDGVYVKGKVLGTKVKFTADTGAARTVLSTRAYDKILNENKPTLNPPEMLTGASGKPLRELGRADFDVQLGH